MILILSIDILKVKLINNNNSSSKKFNSMHVHVISYVHVNCTRKYYNRINNIKYVMIIQYSILNSLRIHL